MALMMVLNPKKRDQLRYQYFDPIPEYYIPLEHRCTFSKASIYAIIKDQCLCTIRGIHKMHG